MTGKNSNTADNTQASTGASPADRSADALLASDDSLDFGPRLENGIASFTLWAPGALGVRVLTAEISEIMERYWAPWGEARTPQGAAAGTLFLELIQEDPHTRPGLWTGSAPWPGGHYSDSRGSRGSTAGSTGPADADPSGPTGPAFQYEILRPEGSFRICDPWAKLLAPFPGRRAEEAEAACSVELQPWALMLDARHHSASGFVSAAPRAGEREENIVIYEAHVRDLTIHPSSGVEGAQAGSFAGLIEVLDYIRDLGVTHLQLLPVMKGYSSDQMNRAFEPGYETRGNNYNWGYDPLNYFMPEGWLSSEPSNPLAAVREFMLLVQEAHRRGLKIILDVVYNHMARTHLLEALNPGYWFRRTPEGNFSSNSGCGNDLATEKPMVRRLIHDSLRWFVQQFDVDGFRFDLMGLIDSETILQAHEMLSIIKPDLIFLGEGWRMYNGPEGTRGMDQDMAAADIPVAMFSDEIRDIMKGGGLNEATAGFISGMEVDRNRLLMNLLGNPQHYFSAYRPRVVVNYLVCHDGLTLHDSIAHNGGIDSQTVTGRRELARRIMAANTLLGTSQGIVFIHAGQERGRSKPNLADSGYSTIGRFVYNSYAAGDGVNAFRWDLDDEFKPVLERMKQVLRLRARESLFHLDSHAEIQARVKSLSTPGSFSFAYALEDGDRGLIVAVNLEEQTVSCDLASLLAAGGSGDGSDSGGSDGGVPHSNGQPAPLDFRLLLGDGSLEGSSCSLESLGSTVIEYRR